MIVPAKPATEPWLFESYTAPVERHARSRRLFLAGAALLLVMLGAAAFVFREGLREQWLLWRLDHSGSDVEKACMKALGEMGSLRAIEPLARRLEDLPPSYDWHFSTTSTVLRSLDALSALLSIARTRREKSIPYLETSSVHGTSPTSKEAFDQLVLVARGKKASIDLGRTPRPGRDPAEVEEE